MEMIDAYLHCGLRKYEPIEQVRRVLDAAGVHRAVLVQHLDEFDNDYIGQIAAAEPERFAGVCLVDERATDRVDSLAKWAATDRFKGVRLLADWLKRTPALPQAAAELGLTIVLYAPHGLARSVAPLHEFLAAFPHVRMVLTHLGNPDLADGPEFESYQAVFDLARFPGVYFQLSGMGMFCPHPHEPLYGLIEQAAEKFGPSRLLWGSNYPVVGDEQNYISDLRLLLDGKLPIPPDAIPLTAGENARRLWFADTD